MAGLAAVPDNTNVTIVGAWNTRIFTPQWVIANLSSTKEIELGVALSNASLPFQLKFDGIQLRFGANRLILSPLTVSETALNRIQEIAEKILAILPHTPLQAVGINFYYQATDLPEVAAKLFEFPDAARLADEGMNIVAGSVTRRLFFDDLTLNLKIGQESATSAVVDLNYHADTTTPEAAKAHLGRGVLALEARSHKILTKLYNFQLE